MAALDFGGPRLDRANVFRPPFDTPDILPLIYDREQERVCLLQLTESDYNAASFLDERLLPEAFSRAWVPWSEFSAYPRPPAIPCNFIFHIGHVGSTLVSRVLGERGSTLSLREPAVLRTLARLDADPEGFDLRARCGLFLDYLARPFRTDQRALIKATSFVGEIGPDLMALRSTASAILMFVSPQSFLAGIFAGDNSRQEARVNAPSRQARLARRLGEPLAPLAGMTEGESIAMGWLAEALALAEIGRRFEGRVLWLDFDYFLGRPAFWLAACIARLDGTVDAEEAARLAGSPAFQRYSKGQEHAYDTSLREALLTQASRDHAQEIERGLAWLNAMASRHKSVAEDLRLIASARRR